MQKEIKYLGFVVSADRIKLDADKVQAIKEMKPPTDVWGVKAFIGYVSYYRCFCPKFSDIATPLIRLTKKNTEFEWPEECQQSFDKLKNLLTKAPALAFPDPKRDYTLHTDASEGCIGAVLT